ncbi:flagellar filament capping protein FliD [Schaedlerella sp.]|uniref:flagellar filament capping protein FliD n=1 Tax=Schaedlerella sp. TaxID=2676057 RepID=UPI0037461B1D
MASVGSLSSSTSNSIRGYGGLASGLDRDELIKGMTLGTTSKLNQQEQKKQKIEWMQEAVRAISDKMISFHGKYTETLTSSTNLFSSLLWGRNKITTSGDNSKYVSISGTASGADAMTIMGIKQKAQNASLSSTKMASNSIMTSEIINTSQNYTDLKGKTLNFTYGDEDYSIEIGYDFTDNAQAAKAIQSQLNAVMVDDKTKLGDLVKVEGNAGGFTIKKGDIPDKDITLTGGTALANMGISIADTGKTLDETGVKTTGTVKTQTLAQFVSGQSLTFSYNGTEAKIDLGQVESVDDTDKDGNYLANSVVASLQKQLNAKFGEGRILVEATADHKLTFKTTVPGEKELDEDGNETGEQKADTSSILKVTGGSNEALSALGLNGGLSNRTNFDEKIKVKAVDIPVRDKDGNPVKNDDGSEAKQDGYKFIINGKEIEVKAFGKDKDGNAYITKRDLVNAINNSDANVTVTYQEAADKFTFTSKVNGASGVIDFSGNDDTAKGILSDAFGLDSTKMDEVVRGKDAIVAVKYAGSEEVVELRRDSNTFTVDGLTMSLKGTFGYDASGNLENPNDVTNAVEVNASADVDKLMDTIKSFVADYNAIVDLVNGELTTKHDRDYDPLTSDQKAELSENEISKWETKAKEGLLYGDSDLRSLSMDLRVVVSGGLLVEFEKIGINLSSSYSDNGKLSIDESKLRAALETDPESVEKLFTSKAGVDAEGNETFNGLATNLKSVMDKYVKTIGSMETKGILIRKAGSKSAAQSLTQNTYYDQLTALDKLINQLKTRLKTEQDRYISQFSTLETMIANMNSQSSYLSSMGGY